MEKKVFTFDKLPQSVSELQQLGTLQSPFETAALAVLALVHYPKKQGCSDRNAQLSKRTTATFGIRSTISKRSIWQRRLCATQLPRRNFSRE